MAQIASANAGVVPCGVVDASGPAWLRSAFGIVGTGMAYELSVQPPSGSQGQARSLVESIIADIPGVRDYPEAGMFEYGRPPSVLRIFVEGEPNADSVCLRLATQYHRKDTISLALLLAFRIADRLGWQVCDRRAGGSCERSALDGALRSQRKFGQTADQILVRRASGYAPCPGVFLYYFLRPAPAVIVLALLLTAGLPGYLIYALSLPVRVFVWLAMGAGLVVFGASALASSLAHARRARENAEQQAANGSQPVH